MSLNIIKKYMTTWRDENNLNKTVQVENFIRYSYQKTKA